MVLERERKFLVKDLTGILLIPDRREQITQMYIVDRNDHSLRIRIIDNEKAFICYKYYLDSESKEEHEYPFPLEEAIRIFDNSEYVSFLNKTRFKLDGWDIDKYPDGLRVAEYEFTEDNPLPDPLPDWIGEEITGQYEYSNPAIAKKINNI